MVMPQTRGETDIEVPFAGRRNRHKSLHHPIPRMAAAPGRAPAPDVLTCAALGILPCAGSSLPGRRARCQLMANSQLLDTPCKAFGATSVARSRMHWGVRPKGR
ncbi:hypothetical protein SAT01_39820 [Sinomonas atrocyanea]|nr:hypothetical protein SAT01_39820 [Sinomonas atrocyanea]